MSDASSHTAAPGAGDAAGPRVDLAGYVGALRRAASTASPPPRPHGLEDLIVAAHAALAGGVAACRHYDGELQIEDKGRNDPVTAADHASNRAILNVLGELRPNDRILSEESRPPAGDLAAGRLWVVDPLDGTKEFIAHNGEFSIMVGLAAEGAARLGAVYQPAAGLLIAGAADGGAWVVANGPRGLTADPLAVGGEPSADGAAIGGPVRFVRSRSHPDERLRRIAGELGEIVQVISGSVGIKCALVARGEADLYVHPVPFLKEWDTCAPEAILRGAGGVVTDCAGEPLAYGKTDPRQPGGIFAGTPPAWRRAREVVARATAALFVADEDDEPDERT